MPNILDANGLQVKTVNEIVADLVTAMQAIYGADINVSSNTPDGQLIGIFSQSVEDILELLVDVYNGFAVESAYGVVLDQRVALNGLTRRAGTFTIVPILVTVDRALNLAGLDGLGTGAVYTIADDAGNQFQLIATHSFGGAGNATLNFQAAVVGQVETTLNTIVNQVTTILGVLSVNNPNPNVSTGVNEESDVALKIRRDKSFYLQANGPAAAVEAALLSIPDVIDAFVAENVGSTPANGVPAHGIWVIVNGGTDAEVGQAIYSKKMMGAAMVGAQSYVVTRPNGTTFTALFDRALSENLYVQFSLTPKRAGVSYDVTVVKTALAAALVYRLNQNPNVGDVVIDLNTIVPDFIVTGPGVSSDGFSYSDVITPSDHQHYFLADVTRITIV